MTDTENQRRLYLSNLPRPLTDAEGDEFEELQRLREQEEG